MKKAFNLCTKYSYSDSEFVSVVAQPCREKGAENKNIYKKEWFETLEIEFENKQFYIPKGYHEILKMGDGDYMTPLPEEQRGTHHTYDTYLKDI